MLNIGSALHRTCSGLTRREVLTIGGLSVLGLTLPDVLTTGAASQRSKRETSVILLWLDGGPSHLETFDPKPETTDTVRGPYSAIKTNVNGVYFSELLPLLAEQMSRLAIIRSARHGIDSHSPQPALTGDIRSTTSWGAVISKLKGPAGDMPPYIHVGSRLNIGGGVLGTTFDPVVVADPTGTKAQKPNFSLRSDISADRFNNRRELLAAVDRLRSNTDRAVEQMDSCQQRAADMLTSPKVYNAFDLTKEKDDLRERYGANFFGQSCVLARRLVEAGTRFVQIKWYDGPAFDGWDVHGADLGGMVRMEQHLCPRFDQAASALIDDLHQRGLLESTLVIALGEFGRTPKINKYGARDHWPHCFSVMLAGGGVPGGTVIGASDREGGYPTHSPVTPLELAATVYRLVGIDTNTDVRVRPFIGSALPVSDLLFLRG